MAPIYETGTPTTTGTNSTTYVSASFGRFVSNYFSSLVEIRNSQTLTAFSGLELGRGCIAFHDTVASWDMEIGFYRYGAGIFSNATIFEVWCPLFSVRQLSGSTRSKIMIRDVNDEKCLSIEHNSTNGILGTSDNAPSGGISIQPSAHESWLFNDTDTNTGSFTQNATYGGHIIFNKLGSRIKIKEGNNASMGQAILAGGTNTVSNTSVTANSRIFLTRAVLGGTPGHLSVGTITASTSFVINSSDAADTSTINWLILEPS